MFSNGEKKTILVAANTIGKKWKKILKAYPNVFHKKRTNVDLQNAWQTMCKKSSGFAIRRWPEGEDCYTERARRVFNLNEGERDEKLVPTERQRA